MRGVKQKKKVLKTPKVLNPDSTNGLTGVKAPAVILFTTKSLAGTICGTVNRVKFIFIAGET